MKPEEALKELSYDDTAYGGKCTFEVRQESIKALKRSIPMKPIGDLNSVPHYRCPACNRAVALYEDSPKHPCCRWCGQKLDWEEANGK